MKKIKKLNLTFDEAFKKLHDYYLNWRQTCSNRDWSENVSWYCEKANFLWPDKKEKKLAVIFHSEKDYWSHLRWPITIRLEDGEMLIYYENDNNISPWCSPEKIVEILNHHSSPNVEKEKEMKEKPLSKNLK